MRYLLLTPGIGGKDGVSCLSRRVALCLRESGGDDVAVWSLTDGDDAVPELGDDRVSIRGARGRKARFATWPLESFVAGCPATIVVVMHAHLAPLALPLRARGARLFHVIHGIEGWKPLTFLQTRALRAAERLLCVSAHSARRLADANPALQPARVVHPGLPHRPRGADTADDGFALLVGRMASRERYKGHDALLDVWPSVVERAPEAKLVVVGGGDDRERLMAKSEALGLLPSVRFVGEISDDELDRLYERCSFFVMPSVNEGFGLVFLEAMRMAKACIGGVGAASEIIEHGTTGFVVDPSDPSALGSSILKLVESRERRASMGARGRERFDDEFTSERFDERFRDALGILRPPR